MKTAYFDCFSGISGDMVLGALIDAGLDYKAWSAEAAKLGLDFSLKRSKVTRGGLKGTKLSVIPADGQPRRNLPAIEKLIDKSKITKTAKVNTLRVFARLAHAEARAHGVSVDKVHFHEVGAVDSIVDIAGAAIALDMMGIERVLSSPLNLGSGVVRFSHGTFPVPAPATAELIKGFPAYASDVQAELTTPTGAAIVTTLADGFGPMPRMEVKSVGYGAGGRELKDRPNLLRVFIGEASALYEEDSASLIETNIDDMDPRLYEHVMERLFEAGALDVWLTPIIMKKSRPAVTLSVLAEAAGCGRAIDLIMDETTTFGVRVSRVDRKKLAREFKEVKTGHGRVRVKLGLKGRKVVKAVPEYEDVKALARKSGKPLREIIDEAEKALGPHDE